MSEVKPVVLASYDESSTIVIYADVSEMPKARAEAYMLECKEAGLKAFTPANVIVLPHRLQVGAVLTFKP